MELPIEIGISLFITTMVQMYVPCVDTCVRKGDKVEMSLFIEVTWYFQPLENK